MTKSRLWIVLILICSLTLSCSKKGSQVTAPPAVKMRLLEGYPAPTISAITSQRKALSAPRGHFAASFALVSKARTWPANQVITVAFQGGSPSLRSQIAQTVRFWTNAANITFDFGPDAATSQFREWANTDSQYAADIRIAFRTGDEGGYWSFVGNDSIKGSLVKPSQPSMNFEGFPDVLPPDWQATVLHEFGHALGFEHEHQSPVAPCETEFRWNDDTGYVPTRDIYKQFVPDAQGRRPGIYTVLEGPPNNWQKDQIDFNLRQLPQSADWILTTFDKNSIMKYQFDAWMFTQGIQSGCYSDENLVLSATDIEAAQKIYPRAPNEIAAAMNTQIKANQELIKLPGLPSQMQSEYKANIAAVRKAKR